MNRFDDFPYGPLIQALNTLVGRILLVAAAALAGFMLGTMTAMRSWQGLQAGFAEAVMLGVNSIFFGIGLFAIPVTLFFTIGFVLWEWRLRYVLVVTLLMWINIHQTVRWTAFDSPQAQAMKAMQTELIQSKDNPNR